ncbi:MAG: DUF3990 domain-containing protein [Lachnospiraceae bacterium]|nr:DUF3990 domain-containing protein [Lachnospiraceae bacterium]
MRVYHTGYLELKKPDVHYGRENADFGQGFYVTPEQEFALRWAKAREGQQTIINEYELDLSGLNVHRFDRSIDWFRYIFKNRKTATDMLDVDVVIGPIANDIIFDTMGIISSGFLEEEEALRLLLVGPEFHQIALKTEAAAVKLNWLGARVIGKDELEANAAWIEAEQKKYLEQLAEVIDEAD